MKKPNRRIEANARCLYAELRTLGKCPIGELRARTELPLQELALALGWLVREERIETDGAEVRLLCPEFYF